MWGTWCVLMGTRRARAVTRRMLSRAAWNCATCHGRGDALRTRYTRKALVPIACLARGAMPSVSHCGGCFSIDGLDALCSTIPALSTIPVRVPSSIPRLLFDTLSFPRSPHATSPHLPHPPSGEACVAADVHVASTATAKTGSCVTPGWCGLLRHVVRRCLPWTGEPGGCTGLERLGFYGHVCPVPLSGPITVLHRTA